jgi:hypothetical protein
MELTKLKLQHSTVQIVMQDVVFVKMKLITIVIVVKTTTIYMKDHASLVHNVLQWKDGSVMQLLMNVENVMLNAKHVKLLLITV